MSDLNKYQEYFQTLQKNHLDQIDQTNAMAMFEKSGLQNSVPGVLLKVFQLVDRQKEGLLNKNEFCMAFHLIVLLGKKMIVELPLSIPDVLVQSCTVKAPPVPSRRRKPAVPPRR